MQLSKDLEVTLNLAYKDARKKRHELMSVEHMLLALLDNAEAAQVLRACGGSTDAMRQELTEFLDSTTPLISTNVEEQDTQPTLGFQRVIQRAMFHVNSSGRKEVSSSSVLVAVFSEQESHAVYVLRKQGVNRIDVVNYIAHGTQKSAEEQSATAATSDEEGGEEKTPLSLIHI